MEEVEPTNTEREAKTVRNFLSKINLFALLTREGWSYDQYGDLAEHSFNGIDCAFFIPCCQNIVLGSDYVVLTFDRTEEPEIDTEKNLVRAGHDIEKGSEGSDFTSDSPEDYLTLYSNADRVYTDRMHALIPSLVFGTPCKYVWEKPKNIVFENLNIQKDGEGFSHLDKDDLEKKKQKQIEFLSEVLGVES